MTNNLNRFTNLFDGSAVKERLLGLGATLNGLLKVKLGRPFLKVLLLLPPVVGVRRNLSLVKVLITYLAHLYRLQRTGGLRFLVIYLKSCFVLLQQSIGGQRLSDTGPLGARVSRSRSGGIPRIIPVLHRERIRNGETTVIKLWLSLFSVFRVVEIPGKVKTLTITSPFTGRFSLIDEFSDFVGVFWKGLREGVGMMGGPIIDALRGKGIMTFLPTLKAVPELLSKSSPVVSDAAFEMRISSTSPLAILLTARVWDSIMETTELGEAFKSWCRITGNRWITNIIETFAKGPPDPRGVILKRKDGTLVGYDTYTELHSKNKKGKRERYLKGVSNIAWRRILGKLGTKLEAAGKVRVFAMVDCFTQWIMRPLHDAIFRLLKTIPQDGTHDQEKPLVRLLERRRELIRKNIRPGDKHPSRMRLEMKHFSMYSYDLTAATDRLPVAFQTVLLAPFLGSWLSQMWQTILVGREYWLFPSGKDRSAKEEPTPCRYAVGQPMGALSSWAMLALTHHCIVQWAWYRVCIRDGKRWSWYREYAVLGDDIVLLGSQVAGAYRDLLHTLGVEVNFSKSLISKKGIAVEFAKRTFYKGMNVSAVSLKECLVAKRNISAGLDLCRKYNLTLGAYCKFLGYGYKSLGSLTKRLWSLPPRLRNYIVAFTGPGMPSFRDLVSWLTQKSILSSYLKTEGAMDSLWDSFVQCEKERLLAHLERVETLYARANIATAQYREGGKLIIRGVVYEGFPYHPGIRGVEPEVLDLLNSVVYRSFFVEGITRLHEIRDQVMEIGGDREVDIVALWNLVDELDDSSSLIPGLANVTTARDENKLGAGLELVNRWVRYSRPFRSTTKRV